VEKTQVMPRSIPARRSRWRRRLARGQFLVSMRSAMRIWAGSLRRAAPIDDDGDAAAVGRDVFLEMHSEAPARIILDVDATDDPLHGNQEGKFFHGYYKAYCYLPLYIFCGDHLLCARLRQSNNDGAAGTVEEVERIVERIRTCWPDTRIIVRGDSGFYREDLMVWCEDHYVDFLLGLARNRRLELEVSEELALAKALYQCSEKASRVFRDFCYKPLKTWRWHRRVVGKAEHLGKGANPRFVVTSLKAGEHDARELYEKMYCARGEMENRIKEQQLMLFADRTSTQDVQ